MADNHITFGELTLLLLFFGGPVYLLMAVALHRWLARRGLLVSRAPTRIVGLLVAAVTSALPLTVAMWWLWGQLHLPIPDTTRGSAALSFAAYVTPPAIVASLISFAASAAVARFWLRAPSV